MTKPEDINYDIPMEFLRIFTNEEETIIATIRTSINWNDINLVEDYPIEWNTLTDWKEFADRDKCYLNILGDRNIIILTSYNEIVKYWIYYNRFVKKVDGYQYPDYIRSRTKTINK